MRQSGLPKSLSLCIISCHPCVERKFLRTQAPYYWQVLLHCKLDLFFLCPSEHHTSSICEVALSTIVTQRLMYRSQGWLTHIENNLNNETIRIGQYFKTLLIVFFWRGVISPKSMGSLHCQKAFFSFLNHLPLQDNETPNLFYWGPDFRLYVPAWGLV